MTVRASGNRDSMRNTRERERRERERESVCVCVCVFRSFSVTTYASPGREALDSPLCGRAATADPISGSTVLIFLSSSVSSHASYAWVKMHAQSHLRHVNPRTVSAFHFAIGPEKLCAFASA